MALKLIPKLSRMSNTMFSVVYVTVPNAEVADKLAKSSVETKLAACVNIIPNVKSVYEWNNTIEESSEFLLMIKTKKAALDALKEHIIKNHPYEVPEFISVPIEYGYDSYLQWINEKVVANQKVDDVDNAKTNIEK